MLARQSLGLSHIVEHHGQFLTTQCHLFEILFQFPIYLQQNEPTAPEKQTKQKKRLVLVKKGPACQLPNRPRAVASRPNRRNDAATLHHDSVAPQHPAQLLHVAHVFFCKKKIRREGKMETVVRIRHPVFEGFFFSRLSSANARTAPNNLKGKDVWVADLLENRAVMLRVFVACLFQVLSGASSFH
ncbi:hypothetical protein M440DRAFT_1268228 [Trichoderma longibrachiatum ATCC 18648]|uniref:Uncharacterized protein n=1 Tax=Trichoderma longibrachiatum ATCC 18648 TaxID=983965 RepID=A0A2T4C0I8_TRILO|nr:hypothetical protein M440DRAFT_1268228 [Trichoderma longibrachiatum ATCC 18648]